MFWGDEVLSSFRIGLIAARMLEPQHGEHLAADLARVVTGLLSVAASTSVTIELGSDSRRGSTHLAILVEGTPREARQLRD
ncbi:MAG: hypothetical protein ABI400_07370, partial [Lacisediminihabitans sp.]